MINTVQSSLWAAESEAPPVSWLCCVWFEHFVWCSVQHEADSHWSFFSWGIYAAHWTQDNRFTPIHNWLQTAADVLVKDIQNHETSIYSSTGKETPVSWEWTYMHSTSNLFYLNKWKVSFQLVLFGSYINQQVHIITLFIPGLLNWVILDWTGLHDSVHLLELSSLYRELSWCSPSKTWHPSVTVSAFSTIRHTSEGTCRE